MSEKLQILPDQERNLLRIRQRRALITQFIEFLARQPFVQASIDNSVNGHSPEYDIAKRCFDRYFFDHRSMLKSYDPQKYEKEIEGGNDDFMAQTKAFLLFMKQTTFLDRVKYVAENKDLIDECLDNYLFIRCIQTGHNLDLTKFL